MFDSVESNRTPSASNITNSIMLNEYCAGGARRAPDGVESASYAFALGAVGAPGVGGRRAARNCDDFARGQVIAAMRTDHVGRGLGAASAMDQCHRRARFVAQPGVAPSHHRDEDGVEFEALARQAILDAAGVAFAAGAIEDVIAHQVAQPRAEDIARDAGGI